MSLVACLLEIKVKQENNCDITAQKNHLGFFPPMRSIVVNLKKNKHRCGEQNNVF